MKQLRTLALLAATLAGAAGAVSAADTLGDAHAAPGVPPFVTERVDFVVTFPEAPRPGRAG